jgi:hypothetical protein
VRVQPEECIYWKVQNKVPGLKFEVEQVGADCGGLRWIAVDCDGLRLIAVDCVFEPEEKGSR